MADLIKVAVFGASGKMGGCLLQVAQEVEAVAAVAAVIPTKDKLLSQDAHAHHGIAGPGLPFSDLKEGFKGADVVIDFSHAEGTSELVKSLLGSPLPFVCGTTGLAEDTQKALDSLADKAPVFQASNMSVGANLLFHLAGQASSLLPEAEAEIFEMHHRYKKDAPSGTAVTLGESVASARGQTLEEVVCYGREGQSDTRRAETIAIHALRGGDVVGEHTLYLQLDGERIELGHRCTNRLAFARGAMKAAQFLTQQKPGAYGMKDLLGF